MSDKIELLTQDYKDDLKIAFEFGYNHAVRLDRTKLIQRLYLEAETLSKSLPELAEGIRLACDLIADTNELEFLNEKNS